MLEETNMEFTETEIGNTPLHEVMQLSGRYGAHVYVKDESTNPYGTFKDRRNHDILSRDRGEGSLFYVQITSGNSGYSLGRMCADYRAATGRERHAISLVGRDVPPAVRKELERHSILEDIDLGKEPIPNHLLEEIGRRILEERGLEGDVRPVERALENGNGYGEIVREISRDMYPARPDYIFCPVGEGELMAKMALTLRREPGPTIIGVTAKSNVYAHNTDFVPRAGTSFADKLSTRYSDFRSLLRRLCDEDGHEIIVVPEKAIRDEYEFIRGMRIEAEPSAAAAFAGARHYAEENGLGTDDIMVIVNTGRGLYAPARSEKRSRLARALAIPLALSVPLMFGDAVPWISPSRYYEIQESHIEREKQELASDPIYNDIYAYALYVGGMERVDQRTLNSLESWYVYTDMITRMRYNENPEFRRIIDEFNEWTRRQREAREARIERASKAWKEHAERQHSSGPDTEQN